MAGPVGAAAWSTDEEGSVGICIKSFDSKKDDFGRWVSRFEKAVTLSTKDRDQESLHRLYKNWLPLKLDDEASTHLELLDSKSTNWPELKAQLVDLLIDPHHKLRWKARQLTIEWDGKESMQALATRVVRAVDKYDKHLPQALKEQEYFTRFRNAFRKTQWKTLRRVIDMNCPEGQQNIDTAKDAIMRYLLANADDGDDEHKVESLCALSSARSPPDPEGTPGIQRSLAIIAKQMENIARSVHSLENRLDNFERRLRAVEERRHYGGCPHGAESHSRRSYTRERDEPERSSSDQDAESYGPRRSYTRGNNGSSSENSSDYEEEAYQFASEHRNARHHDRQRPRQNKGRQRQK